MKILLSLRWVRYVFFGVIAIAIPVGTTVGWIFLHGVFSNFPASVYIAVMSILGMIVTRQLVLRADRKNLFSQEDFDLMAKSRQFLSLYRQSPIPYLTIDRTGMIVMHNLAALRLFQTNAEVLTGKIIDSVIRHENETELSLILGKLQTLATVSETETQIETMRGEIKWVLISVFASEDSNERLVSLVDITHQKRVDLAKSEFVALATHQLRTPITAIRWNTELLAKTMTETKTEKQQRYLEKIERNVRRMLALINDFLSVSKLETGTFATDLSKIDMATFMEAVIDEYTEMIEQKQLKLERKFEATPVTFKSDERLLHIIVSNLLSNAVKYTVDGGALLVGFSVQGDELSIEIADSGIGIPEEELSKLFTKFFRASNAQTYRTEGTGLGLYIVKQSVEKLGGTITPHSVLEQGTHFEVRLPL